MFAAIRSLFAFVFKPAAPPAVLALDIPLVRAMLCVEMHDAGRECQTVFDAGGGRTCPRCGSASSYPLALAVSSWPAKNQRRTQLSGDRASRRWRAAQPLTPALQLPVAPAAAAEAPASAPDRRRPTRQAGAALAAAFLALFTAGCHQQAQDRISDMGNGAVLVELAGGGSCIRYPNGSMSCSWADGSHSELDAHGRRAHYPAIGRFAPVSLGPPVMRATAQAAATCHH